MITNAGQLDRVVHLFRPVDALDDYGQPMKTWEYYATDWALREDLQTIKDDERVMNGAREVASAFTRFTLRFRTDIQPTHRLNTDGVWFEVSSPTKVEGRNAFVIINAEQRDDIEHVGDAVPL
jgi:head-tail adaptor